VGRNYIFLFLAWFLHSLRTLLIARVGITQINK
jgi:hypothetical protein